MWVASAAELDELRRLAQAAVKTAVEHCTERSGDTCITRQELLPSVETIETGLRSDGSEVAGVEFQELDDFSDWESCTYVEAIAGVTGRRLERDRDVFVLGEEVANFGGGPYAATKGLPTLYPDRVFNTPISECGFVGLAGGAAMSGLKPIVEIMFPDFCLVAADQLFNQLGKLRHMYGNSTDMPVVVRTRIAIGCGYGGQHSMDPVGIFSLFSGWRMVAPSNAFDYVGLFNSAMQSKDPVLIVEHNCLYPVKSEVPRDNLDYFVRLGKAKIVESGSDVTALCYSSTVTLVRQAAAELRAEKISVEVIDLRTLSPADIDYETIGDSLRKTTGMAIVEQAPVSMGIGARIACECQERFFDYLDGPVATVNSLDIPLPVSKGLEAAAVPSVESVKKVLREAAHRQI